MDSDVDAEADVEWMMGTIRIKSRFRILDSHLNFSTFFFALKGLISSNIFSLSLSSSPDCQIWISGSGKKVGLGFGFVTGLSNHLVLLN